MKQNMEMSQSVQSSLQRQYWFNLLEQKAAPIHRDTLWTWIAYLSHMTARIPSTKYHYFILRLFFHFLFHIFRLANNFSVLITIVINCCTQQLLINYSQNSICPQIQTWLRLFELFIVETCRIYYLFMMIFWQKCQPIVNIDWHRLYLLYSNWICSG